MFNGTEDPTEDVSTSAKAVNGTSDSPDEGGDLAKQEEDGEIKVVPEETSGIEASTTQPALQNDELEARLRKLEERITSLEDYDEIPDSEQDETDDVTASDPPKRRDQLCDSTLTYLSVKEYDSRNFSLSNRHSAIEVITSSGGFFANDKEKSPGDEGDRAYKNFGQLIFIQINSVALLNAMKATHPNLVKYWVDESYVILAPFKSLHYEEAKLRELLTKLEAMWPEHSNTLENGITPRKTVAIVPAEGGVGEVVTGGENESKVENGIVKAPSDTTDSPDLPSDKESDQPPDLGPESLTAYRHLMLLMDFFDTRVKPWWSFLRSSQIESVQFGDLCALYAPGDFITMPDHPQRVFRVANVIGGRPKMEQLYKGVNAPALEESQDADGEAAQSNTGTPDKDRNNWTTLKMDCFYIDYDGTEFGAVATTWKIKPFTGAKDIKKLRPYPLRFAPAKLKEECRNEGLRFLDMTDPKKRPALYRYEGRTLTQRSDGVRLCRSGKSYDNGDTPVSDYLSQEDVDAQVVIDFDATFLYNSGWTPDFNEDAEMSTANTDEDDASNLPNGCPLKTSSIYIECFHAHDTRRSKRFLEENPWVTDDPVGEDDYDDDKEHRARFQSSSGDFTDDVLLLPNRAVGYVLRSRTWSCFDLSTKAHWRVVKENEQSWKELQIKDSHRRTLASLVERHFRNRRAVKLARLGERVDNFDFIEGKGKGLIILLHGAPGVGKTSTAESIASLYGKPLLPITCGNLGTDARMVEQSLQENFRLAESWGCIVLLDEADVFLARREKNDLQRNALVSVFLRMLEYYTGILFLTTNRTGDFDEAFRSRIHVSLYYHDLDRTRTLKVWEINLDRVIKQQEGKRYAVTREGREKILRYAERHWTAYRILQRSPWNGRQIRNAFQTAVALAEYTGIDNREEFDKDQAPAELTWEHFRKVATATNQFEAYLLETRGKSEEEQASEFYLRAKMSTYGTENDEESELPNSQKWRKVSSSKAAEFINQLHPDHEVVEPDGLDEAPPESSDDVFVQGMKSFQRQHSVTRTSHHLVSPTQTPGPQGAFGNTSTQFYDTRISGTGMQMAPPMYSPQVIPQGYMQAGQVHNPAYYQQQQAPPMMAGQIQNHYPSGNYQQADASQVAQPPQNQAQFQQGQPQQTMPANSGQTYPMSSTPLVQHLQQPAPNGQGQPQQNMPANSGQTLPMSSSPLVQHAQQPAPNGQGQQQMQPNLYGQPMYQTGNQAVA